MLTAMPRPAKEGLVEAVVLTTTHQVVELLHSTHQMEERAVVGLATIKIPQAPARTSR